MPVYAVESKRQPMTATGIVQPVTEWEDGPGGKRRPSDRQAKDEQSGLLLWLIEVMYLAVAFGRESTATAMVRVPSSARPTVTPLTGIEFDGLRCDVGPTKAGGFSERWSADGVAGAKQTRSSGGS
jgi:hypothetical protein